MTNRTLTRFAFGAVTAIAVAGASLTASAQSTVVIAPSAPPPPRVETIPAPPTADAQVMTWHAGHWMWNGSNWSWEEGHYVQRPAPTAVWEPGHWSQESSGGYVWVDGHWRS
ncbi:MAG TPA: hypothetical protein VGG99_16515 [Acetobacteraceae bacterium]|jgi:hypothetical protein